MRYAHVESALWSEESFVGLSPEAKLLHLWAVSNSRINPAGLYAAAERLVIAETGIDVSRIRGLWMELELADLVIHLDGWLWVKHHVRDFLAGRGTSEKQAQGVVRAIEKAPEGHPLREQCFTTYRAHPALEALWREPLKGSESPQVVVARRSGVELNQQDDWFNRETAAEKLRAKGYSNEYVERVVQELDKESQ
jgi:hypothetical protein